MYYYLQIMVSIIEFYGSTVLVRVALNYDVLCNRGWRENILIGF